MSESQGIPNSEDKGVPSSGRKRTIKRRNAIGSTSPKPSEPWKKTGREKTFFSVRKRAKTRDKGLPDPQKRAEIKCQSSREGRTPAVGRKKTVPGAQVQSADSKGHNTGKRDFNLPTKKEGLEDTRRT